MHLIMAIIEDLAFYNKAFEWRLFSTLEQGNMPKLYHPPFKHKLYGIQVFRQFRP